jgi:hypothetical protein
MVRDPDGRAYPRCAGFWHRAPRLVGFLARAALRMLQFVKREQMRRTRRDIAAAAQEGMDWLSFAAQCRNLRADEFGHAGWS